MHFDMVKFLHCVCVTKLFVNCIRLSFKCQKQKKKCQCKTLTVHWKIHKDNIVQKTIFFNIFDQTVAVNKHF